MMHLTDTEPVNKMNLISKLSLHKMHLIGTGHLDEKYIIGTRAVQNLYRVMKMAISTRLSDIYSYNGVKFLKALLALLVSKGIYAWSSLLCKFI